MSAVATVNPPTNRRRVVWLHTKVWLPQLAALITALCLAPSSGRLHRVVHSGLSGVLDFESGPLVNSAYLVVDSVLPVALAAVIVLVFLGTLDFLKEAKSSDRATEWAKRLTWLSVLIGGAWMIGLVTTDERMQWSTTGHGVEYVAGAIFGLFLLIDVLFLMSIDRQIRSLEKNASDEATPEYQSLTLKRVFSVDSILFVDLPVLLGIVVIYLVTIYINSQPVFLELTKRGQSLFVGGAEGQRRALIETFLRGLTTGALVMHVAFSQFVFGFIKMRDIRRRARMKLLDDVYV